MTTWNSEQPVFAVSFPQSTLWLHHPLLLSTGGWASANSEAADTSPLSLLTHLDYLNSVKGSASTPLLVAKIGPGDSDVVAIFLAALIFLDLETQSSLLLVEQQTNAPSPGVSNSTESGAKVAGQQWYMYCQNPPNLTESFYLNMDKMSSALTWNKQSLILANK